MKSQTNFKGRALYESILIPAKLGVMLSVIPLFSLTRYLILSQISLNPFLPILNI